MAKDNGGPAGGGPRTQLAVIAGGRQTSRYKAEEFLVGGRGTGPGDVEKQSFKLHEGYIREADLVMRGGLFPYKTLTDLYRHAIVRHIWWLKSLEPEEIEGSILYQVAQIDELVAEEEFQLRFTKTIENTAKMVRNTIHLPGGRAHVGQVLRRMLSFIKSSKPGYWRSYHEMRFREEFGPYLTDGLTLIDLGAGDEGEGDGENDRWGIVGASEDTDGE